MRPASFTAECLIPLDHSCLAGHFPGNPIVPGVVILDEVIEAARQWLGTATILGLPRVKFLAVLSPGESFAITLDYKAATRIKFRCTQGARLLAMGEIDLDHFE